MTLTQTGPEPVDVAVGARIRIRRRSLEFSQTQLANALGITFQQVQKYERGANRVSASMLVKIAAKLETTVAALVGEDGKTDSITPQQLQWLATPGATELLAAYAQIKDGDLRRAVQTITDGIVDRQPGGRRLTGDQATSKLSALAPRTSATTGDDTKGRPELQRRVG